ncbi:MAG: hypothetical protein IKD44_10195 [Lentisphaeria bacterium]|nr:hypothetical protein [Lentisphaeria bacterium]
MRDQGTPPSWSRGRRYGSRPAEAQKAGIDFADNLMVSCTHTHTGPEIRRNIDAEKQAYIDAVIAKTVTALKEADM